MDPITIITLANAALALVEQAVPQIQALANKGEITADQQASTLAAYQSLKATVEAGPFAGPEWQVSQPKGS
jgi:outer membrane protein TolC